jgi:hypothetical protein
MCQFATGKNCYSKTCNRPECEGEQQMKNDGDQIQCTVEEWIILQSPVCNQAHQSLLAYLEAPSVGYGRMSHSFLLRGSSSF